MGKSVKIIICAAMVFIGTQPCASNGDTAKCSVSRVFIHNQFYKIDKLTEFKNKYISNIRIKDSSITYKQINRTQLAFRDQPKEVHIKNGRKVFNKDGKLYIQMENKAVPQMLFQIPSRRFVNFAVDQRRNILFGLVTEPNNETMKSLIALKLQKLKDHKYVCPSNIVMQMGKFLIDLDVDDNTGVVIMSMYNDGDSYIVQLNPTEKDPCADQTDVSPIVHTFQTTYNVLKNLIRLEAHRIDVNRMKDIKSAMKKLSSLHRETVKELLNDKMNNETSLQKKNDELALELRRNNNNRIKLAKQITILIDAFEDVPDMSSSFPSRKEYDEVPLDERGQYQCALAEEFKQNKMANKNIDFFTGDILENLEALQSEAASQDEIQLQRSADDILEEEIQDIFGSPDN